MRTIEFIVCHGLLHSMQLGNIKCYNAVWSYRYNSVHWLVRLQQQQQQQHQSYSHTKSDKQIHEPVHVVFAFLLLLSLKCDITTKLWFAIWFWPAKTHLKRISSSSSTVRSSADIFGFGFESASFRFVQIYRQMEISQKLQFFQQRKFNKPPTLFFSSVSVYIEIQTNDKWFDYHTFDTSRSFVRSLIYPTALSHSDICFIHAIWMWWQHELHTMYEVIQKYKTWESNTNCFSSFSWFKTELFIWIHVIFSSAYK